MSLHKHKLQVLAILLENLRTSHPQLVSTAAIAGKMGIQLPKLHQVLKAMDGIGIIKTDSDLKYNLLTRKGLNYLSEIQITAPAAFKSIY